jgi:hypothetical protein
MMTCYNDSRPGVLGIWGKLRGMASGVQSSPSSMVSILM